MLPSGSRLRAEIRREIVCDNKREETEKRRESGEIEESWLEEWMEGCITTGGEGSEGQRGSKGEWMRGGIEEGGMNSLISHCSSSPFTLKMNKI